MNDTTIPYIAASRSVETFPSTTSNGGGIATFIDAIPDPEGIETGYIIEVSNALGESIDVVTVKTS
jgi:hypothetical protein